MYVYNAVDIQASEANLALSQPAGMDISSGNQSRALGQSILSKRTVPGQSKKNAETKLVRERHCQRSAVNSRSRRNFPKCSRQAGGEKPAHHVTIPGGELLFWNCFSRADRAGGVFFLSLDMEQGLSGGGFFSFLTIKLLTARVSRLNPPPS